LKLQNARDADIVCTAGEENTTGVPERHLLTAATEAENRGMRPGHDGEQ
jgi:hypothetical protein